MSSTDSFQSDSDFSDLENNAAVESGRVEIDDDEGGPGFKRKSFIGTLWKRHSRRFAKTKFGKKLRYLREDIEDWSVSRKITSSYKSLYSGVFLMMITLVNLLSIPYVQYYETI